jgi:hypothetical protein
LYGSALEAMKLRALGTFFELYRSTVARDWVEAAASSSKQQPQASSRRTSQTTRQREYPQQINREQLDEH